MNSDPFARLPHLRPDCKLSVVIPARNEASQILPTLEALDAQRSIDGRALEADLFDIIVFANDCTDDTAAVVRAWSARPSRVATGVVAGSLPRGAAHVGTARKLVMDAAAARFMARECGAGIVASTDADTIPDERWIAWTLREAANAEAVTGRIELEAAERSALPPALAALYLRDDAYQQALAELEAIDDPVQHDPLPRHGQHFGASFAVNAAAYVRAGGIRPLAYLEDLDLYRRLVRIDARVRHSPLVRVTTSSRRSARVVGGFATFLGDLEARAANGDTLFVEDPHQTRERFRARAALRRAYQGRATREDRAAIADAYDEGDAALAALDRSRPFGENMERLEATLERSARPGVSIATAIDTLRAMLARSGSPSTTASAPSKPDIVRARRE